jgi:malonyl CoA-acyl carrier protein transacylase
MALVGVRGRAMAAAAEAGPTGMTAVLGGRRTRWTRYSDDTG